MAKLAEYDEKKIKDHSDSELLLGAIICMEAINKLPIHESSNTDTDCEFKGFGKTFWGKQKLVAYCKLSIIEDLKLEITLPIETTNIPPHLNVAVGFIYSSESSSFILPIGSEKIREKEKIILSYYRLMEYIDVTFGFYKGIETGFDMKKTMNLSLVKAVLKQLKYEVATNE